MSSSDSDRPPVLAHQRFIADRNSFARLDLAQRFARIHDTNLWGAEASASGLGSEIDATAVLRAELPRLLARLSATSLLDAPCGDAGWINQTELGVGYLGVDIVPPLIAHLRARAAAGEIGGEYRQADITADPLPRCDAILCRDALVHLSFANIGCAVANFRASGAIWLIATTFPEWQTNGDCEDGDWRALNFERAPFSWGAPVELLNENCTEAGGGWRDKSLGVWPLAEIGGLHANETLHSSSLPLWEPRRAKLALGWTRCEAPRPGEGSVSADRDPSSGADFVRATFSHKGRREGIRTAMPTLHRASSYD
jgi:SAM-dependent methyltransferase